MASWLCTTASVPRSAARCGRQRRVSPPSPGLAPSARPQCPPPSPRPCPQCPPPSPRPCPQCLPPAPGCTPRPPPSPGLLLQGLVLPQLLVPDPRWSHPPLDHLPTRTGLPTAFSSSWFLSRRAPRVGVRPPRGDGRSGAREGLGAAGAGLALSPPRPQMTYSLTRFAIYESVRDRLSKGSQGPLPFHHKVLLGGISGEQGQAGVGGQPAGVRGLTWTSRSLSPPGLTGGFVGTPADLVNVRWVCAPHTGCWALGGCRGHSPHRGVSPSQDAE